MAAGSAIADDPTSHADVENRFGSEGLDYGHAQRGRRRIWIGTASPTLPSRALKALLNVFSARSTSAFSIRASG